MKFIFVVKIFRDSGVREVFLFIIFDIRHFLIYGDNISDKKQKMIDDE